MRVHLIILIFFAFAQMTVKAAKKQQPVKCPEYPLTQNEDEVLKDIKAKIEKKEEISKEFFSKNIF